MKYPLGALFLIAMGYAIGLASNTNDQPPGVPVTLTGGHETDPRDHGRPVVLVAAGLGVTPEVFREAFSHVKPAAAGEKPDPQQVQLNKRALLGALAKFGVTNDRLDEVSNEYRYPPGKRNLWKHTDAKVYAGVANGKVSGFVIQDPGAGYTTPPEVTVPGFPDLAVKVTLKFGPDLATNGSIASVELTKPTTRPTSEPGAQR